jgi:lysophospholipase L1-like esterase
MVWDEVLPTIKRQLAKVAYFPDMVIIHCGGNSITKVPKKYLISKIKSDIFTIYEIFGQSTSLVWSNVLPRLHWRSALKFNVIEDIRQNINRTIGREILYLGGHWIKHVEITSDTPGLFRNDGVHLSPIGLDIFNLSLKDAIEAMLSGCSKGIFE